MRAANFDYLLPEAAIAQHPIEPRSAARMLVDLTPEAPPVHCTVADLPTFVEQGDVVVVNETLVIAARIYLRKPTGGAAEVFLLEPLPGEGEGVCWSALVRPGRSVREGTVLVADDGSPVVEVGPRLDGDGRRLIRLLADAGRYANLPLPPYIHEALSDPERYQTVYARTPGSVAAPTAGLHLTPKVLGAIRDRGAEVHTVDLAIGLGTFRPLTVDDLDDHVMHDERYSVPAETLEACRSARRTIAIGTTTVRALESAAATGAMSGRTDLFIRPGFKFEVVDVLLTNYHMPRSSLLVLVSAFAGHERWRRLYDEALARGYRFLSFGDCMLISRAGGAP